MNQKCVAALFSFAICALVPAAKAAEPGTIGAQVSQVYNDREPTHLGGLVVRRVDPGSGAADAGLHPGDLILAIDQRNVEGHKSVELLEWLSGPSGTSVQLTVTSSEGKREVIVRRKPYSPHENPETDPFRYRIPGNWTIDPRYTFPLPWAPSIPYKGFEDVGFSSGFDDPESPEYHSYFFLWGLDRQTPIPTEELQSDLTAYYQGLSAQRGRNRNFTPDLSRIHVSLKPLPSAGLLVGGDHPEALEGTFNIYDRRGQLIDLNIEVISTQCSAAGGRTMLFFVSRERRPSGFWNQLDAIRSSFTCRGR